MNTSLSTHDFKLEDASLGSSAISKANGTTKLYCQTSIACHQPAVLLHSISHWHYGDSSTASSHRNDAEASAMNGFEIVSSKASTTEGMWKRVDARKREQHEKSGGMTRQR